jgi:hypothetical protein
MKPISELKNENPQERCTSFSLEFEGGGRLWLSGYDMMWVQHRDGVSALKISDYHRGVGTFTDTGISETHRYFTETKYPPVVAYAIGYEEVDYD